jgi:hypothetical protein
MPREKNNNLFGIKDNKLRSFGKGVNQVGKSLNTASHIIDTGSDVLIMSGDPSSSSWTSR